MADWGAGFIGGVAGLLNALDKYKREQREEQLQMMQLQQKSGLYDIEPVPSTDLTPAPFFSRLMGQRWQPIGGQAVVPYGTSGAALTLKPTPRAINLPPAVLGEIGMDTEDPQVQQFLARTPARDVLKQYWENQQFMNRTKFAEGIKEKQTALATKRDTQKKLRAELASPTSPPERQAAIRAALEFIDRADPNNPEEWSHADRLSVWALAEMQELVDPRTGVGKMQQRGPMPQRPVPGAVVEKPGPAAPAAPGMIGQAPAEAAAPEAPAAPGAPGAPGAPPKRTLSTEQINQREALYGVPTHLATADRLTEPELRKTKIIADDLGVKPADLLTVFSFETGGTMSPAEKNPRSSATGLIQFIEKTAKQLGTSPEELRKMSYEEQLDWVHKYLSPYKGRIGNLKDMYMAVLKPSMIGAPLDAAVFTRNTAEYGPNAGLDRDDNGIVTVREALNAVLNHARGKGAIPPAPIAPTTPPTVVAQAAPGAPPSVTPATPAPGQAAVPGPQEALVVPPAPATPAAPGTPGITPTPAPAATLAATPAATPAATADELIAMPPAEAKRYRAQLQREKDAADREQRILTHQQQETARQERNTLEAARKEQLKHLQELKPPDAAGKALQKQLIQETRKAPSTTVLNETFSQIPPEWEEGKKGGAGEGLTAYQWQQEINKLRSAAQAHTVEGKEEETKQFLQKVNALEFGDVTGLNALHAELNPIPLKTVEKTDPVTGEVTTYTITPAQALGQANKVESWRRSDERFANTQKLKIIQDATKLHGDVVGQSIGKRLAGAKTVDDIIDVVATEPVELYEGVDPATGKPMAMNKKDYIAFTLKTAPVPEDDVEQEIWKRGLNPFRIKEKEREVIVEYVKAQRLEKASSYAQAVENAKAGANLTQTDSMNWIHPLALLRTGDNKPPLNPPAGSPLKDTQDKGYILINQRQQKTIQMGQETLRFIALLEVLGEDIFYDNPNPDYLARVWDSVVKKTQTYIQDPLGRKIEAFERTVDAFTPTLRAMASDSGSFSEMDRQQLEQAISKARMTSLSPRGIADTKQLAQEQFRIMRELTLGKLDIGLNGELAKYPEFKALGGNPTPLTPQSTGGGAPAPGAPGAPLPRPGSPEAIKNFEQMKQTNPLLKQRQP